MEQNFSQTTRGNRIHIGFFGRRNVGKSSLVNAIAGQDVSLVSEVLGTTTDPVEKAMELLPLGPVVLVDTPGLDDNGALGDLRVARTKQTLSHIDLGVLVVDAQIGVTTLDETFLKELARRHIPILTVWNKCDQMPETWHCPEQAIGVSAATGAGIEQLKAQIAMAYQKNAVPQRTLFGKNLSQADVVVLVTPIDESAPKGRLILPQVQAIREILDNFATCLVTQPQTLHSVLDNLKKPPKLVVTDSQAFGIIKEIVPESIPMTSFSILFANCKGVLEPALAAVEALANLPTGSRILIAEGCSHHRQCADIGTVKLPKWIQEYTSKTFQFDFCSGNTFPNDLHLYQLVVHCGGCMLNAKEMETRAAKAAMQGVPFTNYGVLIAAIQGILDRKGVIARN